MGKLVGAQLKGAHYHQPYARVDSPHAYGQLNPGVVNIQVYVQRQGIPGAGGGSGFILDKEGHIVTNNHVIADASRAFARCSY